VYGNRELGCDNKGITMIGPLITLAATEEY
jgi:hypothetical protein